MIQTASPSGFRLVGDDLGWPDVKGLWDVIGVAYGHATNWTLEIELEHPSGPTVHLVFDHAASFRLQDEGDMLGYWASRDREGVAVSSLYRVETSAYLSEFATSISGYNHDLAHYVVCGRDACVEILSSARPRLRTA
ncbi:hypothetical protein [Brevundimonas sp.]|jgi:hypothetical protein|uniref:hypothetical protein n=1 Tax=Brevundimonas sp. TaxID=1871086 RepID=UPI0037BF2403